MRVYALFVLLMYATALNFEASLMSHTLAEVDALDTSQLNCQTPRSHFDELEQTLSQWQNVLENKERIPSHIETLTQMKKLIKHKKYQQLVEKIKTLDLISPPVLSELQSKLQGLQSHDSHEREECTETLMKLCAYLIKQMSNVHQQCQQSPVTVIKVKGKIDDLKIIQSGCQQACQPTCDDEPVTPFDEPSVPEDEPDQPVEETPVEVGPEEETAVDVPPIAPFSVPTPEEPVEETTPPTEEAGTDEPPVNPLVEDSPVEEVIEQEEEWKVPGEETPVQPPPFVFPEEFEESWGEEAPFHPQPTTDPVPVFPEEHEETWGEEAPFHPQLRTIPGLPEEFEETWGEEAPFHPQPTTDPIIFPEEFEESWGEEAPFHPQARSVPNLPEEHEETWGEEAPFNPQPTTDPFVFPEEFEETWGEEAPFHPPPPPPGEQQQCHFSVSVEEVVTFVATQEESALVSELTVEGDYGFGLYFKWLQRWPQNAEGTKFHLASLQHEGRVVLGLYFTYQGIQCVTQNGEAEETVSVEFDDVEGDWGFAYISYSEGQTTCAVQYFEEQPSLRQTGSQHSAVSSLTFQVGGSDGKHPSFQGQVWGQFAVSGVVYVSSLHEFEEYVLACSIPPEDVCQRETTNYGDYEFNGNDDDQHVSVQLNSWSDEYSVSGWFKWYDLLDQEVWHAVFRLSSNANSGEDAVLGDRDLALYVGSEMVRSTLQFTTYTYTDLTGEGNPNLWQTVPYEDQLTQWHYIYFGYNRYEREGFALVQFATHEVKLEFKDINHFVIPEKVLYIGYDGHYPSYSGQFYNFHVNYCDGAFELAPYTEPFGYLPPPPNAPEVPEPEVPEETVEPPPFVFPEEFEETWGEEAPFHPQLRTIPGLPEEFEETWGEEAPFHPPPQPEEEPEVPVGEEEFVEDVIIPEQPIIPHSVPVPDEPLAPVPKIATPPPAPPSEPQVPAVKECEATIDVTKENAADILCAISEYLAQLASGHVPELGINPSRVCFCLEYDDSDDNESFMQVEAILKENDAHTIQKIVAQRRI